MQIAFKSDIGKHRKSNQDYVKVYTNQQNVIFALVADGMGGQLGGDVASDMVVTHLGDEFSKTNLSDIHEIAQWMQKELFVENNLVVDASKKKSELSGMGTTIVGAITTQDSLLVVNVGDSRCYLLHESDFKQLSFDHSLVNELLVSGEISEEEAENYPNKNIITQSLGVSDDVNPTLGFFKITNNDQILLCTDGLTNMVDDVIIKDVLLSNKNIQDKSAELIDLANDAGGLDNITALILDFGAEGEDQIND